MAIDIDAEYKKLFEDAKRMVAKVAAKDSSSITELVGTSKPYVASMEVPSYYNDYDLPSVEFNDLPSIEFKYYYNTNAPASDTKEREAKMQKEEFTKQILAWKKAGHPMYATDVLNMLVEANVLSVYEINEIENRLKKEPVEAKLPRSYFND